MIQAQKSRTLSLRFKKQFVYANNIENYMQLIVLYLKYQNHVFLL